MQACRIDESGYWVEDVIGVSQEDIDADPFLTPGPAPGGMYKALWTGSYWTEADPDAATKQQTALELQVRGIRDQMLAQCDWTILTDSQVTNKTEWESYRQALRDLPQQSGFPDSVTWPSEPAS